MIHFGSPTPARRNAFQDATWSPVRTGRPDDRQDYFGWTVNIAARDQGLRHCGPSSRPNGSSQTAKLRSCYKSNGIAATPEKRSLRGIANPFEIFEIP